MKTMAFWLKNARVVALPQSLLPALAAAVLAARAEGFSLALALPAICGVAAGHLSVNLFDDYFDYRKGALIRPGKCQYLLSGQATPGQLTAVALLLGLAALLAGGVILVSRGALILAWAAAAALLGLSYSGGPLSFSYRGWGESLIALIFGPLLMSGVSYAACGGISAAVITLSLPVGLLTANIAYVHAVMDYRRDRQAGKLTLAARLPNRQARLRVLLLTLALAYGMMLAGISGGLLSPYYALSFLTLPLAARLYYLLAADAEPGDRAGFMRRWLGARNLLVFFCLTLIAAALLR